MNLKRILSAAMAGIMTFTSVWASVPAAAESESISSDISGYDFSLESTDQMGEVFRSAFDEFGSIGEIDDEALSEVYGILINGNTVSVGYTAEQDCTAVVAFIDEETEQLITSVEIQVSADSNIAYVNIDKNELPEYFLLCGYLVDSKTLRPLSREYSNNTYTRDMQNFLAKTTDDFDPDLVVDFDGNSENNFAVYDESFIMIEREEEDTNIVVSRTDTEGTDPVETVYVIEKADSRVTALKNGDVFALNYPEDGDNSVIAKVTNISCSGTTVTITGVQPSIEEIYSFVKINDLSDLENAELDETTAEESVSVTGTGTIETDPTKCVFAYNTYDAVTGGSIGGKASSAEQDGIMGPTENDSDPLEVLVGPSIEQEIVLGDYFNELDGTSLTLSVGINFLYRLYLSDEDNLKEFEIGFQYTLSASLSASVGFELEDKNGDEGIPLAKITIPTPVPGLQVTIVPRLIFSMELSATVSITVSTSITYIKSNSPNRSGIQKNDDTHGLEFQPLHPEAEAGITFTVDIGLKFDIGVELGLGPLSVAHGGIYAKAVAELEASPYVGGFGSTGDETPATIHNCTICISASPSIIITGGISGSVLGINELSFDIDLLTITIPLNSLKFHCCIDCKGHKNGFHWGECEYMSRLCRLMLIDADTGEYISDTNVYEDTTNGEYTTDKYGCFYVYLPVENGTMTASLHVTGSNYHDATATINVPDDEDATAYCNVSVVPYAFKSKPAFNVKVVDLQNNPVAGADVVFSGREKGGSGITISRTTDSMGSAFIKITSRNDTRNYSVKVTKDGVSASTGTVVVPDSNISKTITLKINPKPADPPAPKKYTLTVRLKDNNNKVVTDAFVKVGDIMKSVDNYGKAKFDLPNGTYKILITGSEYNSISREIQVSGKNQSVSYCLTRPKYPVSIRVTSAGKPLADARVTINKVSHYTNSDGYTSFDLENGKYNITTNKAGYADNSGTVTVKGSAASTTIDVSTADSGTATTRDYVIMYSGNTATLARYNGKKTNLTIPQTIEGYTITAIGVNAFNKTKVKKVVIPEGVTSIGSTAFWGCSMLESIHIPASLTTVSADSVFYKCSNLKNVTFGNGISAIPDNMFKNCTGLKKITIPDTVTSIGSSAFSRSGLTEIIIPEGVTTIGSYAFSDNKNLKSVYIPATLTTTGYYSALTGCDSLETVTFGKGISAIPNNLFKSCTWLKSIEIPDTVTKIAGRAFDGCSSLTSVTIPSSVTSISSNAFSNADLKELVIPEGVTSIDSYAFSNNKNLKSIYIPATLTSTGYYSAFTACDSIETVTFGKGISAIPNNLFKSCTWLKSIEIPDTVTKIKGNAFDGCSSLTSVTIPSSVTSIDGNAFSNANIRELVIPEGVTSIGSYAFSNNKNLTSVYIPATLTSTGYYSAFTACDSIETVTFGNGISAIPNNLFRSCTWLKSIEIPETVNKIGGYAFSGCTSLTSLTIPSSVTSINDNAFSGTGIKELIIPEGVTSIGSSAFSNNNNLISVYIPATLTSTGYYSAFKGCDSLETVTFGKGISVIPSNLFRSCTWLKSIEIPETVNKIGGYAFSDCTSLTSVTIPASVTSIGSNAFSGCTEVTLYVQAGSYAEEYADKNEINYRTGSSGKSTNTLSASDTTAETQKIFSSLTPDCIYNIYAFRDASADDMLAADNLLYISQKTADANGTITITPVLREACDEPVYIIKRMDRVEISEADVTYADIDEKMMIEPLVFYNGELLIENTDYYINGVLKLSDSGTYKFTLTGINDYSGIRSCTYEYGAKAVPITPTVTAEAGNGEVTLTWDEVTGAELYRVFIYNGRKYIQAADVTETTYTVSGLTNGSKIGFLVLSQVGGEWSTYTSENVVYATPEAPRYDPVTPEIKVIAGDEQATITWDEVDGADLYRVFAYNGRRYNLLGETEDTRYVATGLTNGSSIGFLVLSRVGGEWSSYTSDDVVFTTPSKTTAKPQITSAEPLPGEAQISWTAVEGAMLYRLFTVKEGRIQPFGDTTETTMLVKGLIGGEETGILVLAQVGKRQWTSYTEDDIVYVTAETAVKPYVYVKPGEDGTVELVWTRVPDVPRYKVMIYVDGKYELAGATRQRCRITLTGLDPNVEYGFLVRGVLIETPKRIIMTPYGMDDISYGSPNS